jgi:hypothetical protein
MAKIDRVKLHGRYGGRCAYCGKSISIKDMQVDHITPRCMNGGDNPENLNPSCRRCNHYKRADTLNGFRVTMKTLHHRVSSIYIVKVAIDYGVVDVKPFDGVFYFEKFTNQSPEYQLQ